MGVYVKHKFAKNKGSRRFILAAAAFRVILLFLFHLR